jgi:hypothetical protein
MAAVGGLRAFAIGVVVAALAPIPAILGAGIEPVGSTKPVPSPHLENLDRFVTSRRTRGLPPTYVFLSACLFAAIAAVATAFLALPGRQASRIAAMEVAS